MNSWTCTWNTFKWGKKPALQELEGIKINLPFRISSKTWIRASVSSWPVCGSIWWLCALINSLPEVLSWIAVWGIWRPVTGINAFVTVELPTHSDHMMLELISTRTNPGLCDPPRLSLPRHSLTDYQTDQCGWYFTHICEENGITLADWPFLVFSGIHQSCYNCWNPILLLLNLFLTVWSEKCTRVVHWRSFSRALIVFRLLLSSQRSRC